MLLMVCACFEALSRCFQKAMRQSDTSLKAAALYMEMDAAQLRRELDGNGHLSLRRVSAMPPVFLQYFALNLVAEVGIPLEVQTAAQVERHLEKAS